MANLSETRYVVMWNDGMTETLRAKMFRYEDDAVHFAATELRSAFPRPFIFKAQEVRP